MPRLAAVSGLLLAVLLVLTGCRADATVTVEVATDGSGTVGVAVELDAKAVMAIGSFNERVRVDDLVVAGWRIDGPTTDASGSVRITATKAFDHPDRLATVLAEVIGPSVISDVYLDRYRKFAQTTWRLSGKIDLSEGLGLLTDDDLAAALDGLPFARSDGELAELAGCPDGSCDPARSFSLTLVEVMPIGSDESTLDGRAVGPTERRWMWFWEIRHRCGSPPSQCLRIRHRRSGALWQRSPVAFWSRLLPSMACGCCYRADAN